MRDPDPHVAESALRASFNAGPEVDRALTSIVNDPGGNPDLRRIAARHLRNRGIQLDPATEQSVTQLTGPADGGSEDGRVIVTDSDAESDAD